jgi:hypothetical protein
MTMRRAVGGVMFGWVLLGIGCPPAGADGGLLRLSAKKGGYQISVFTSPTPLRAGPVDISVLVQDSLTGEPMPGAQVALYMARRGQRARVYRATQEAATNKLFRAVQFELPAPGHWEMEVQVEGPRGLAVMGGAVEAAKPLPRWREIWPWFGWPALVVALFVVHQVLESRKATNAVRPVAAATYPGLSRRFHDSTGVHI